MSTTYERPPVDELRHTLAALRVSGQSSESAAMSSTRSTATTYAPAATAPGRPR